MLPKRVYAEINLDNIQKNVMSVMKKTGGIAVMAVVKADAYGHGAVEVAKALCEIGVNDFGVATVEEAVELRLSGIKSNILILGQIFTEDIPLAVKYDIQVSVCDTDTAKSFSDEAQKQGKKVCAYIKIDTGMGRIGFQANENGFELIKSVFSYDGLQIEGAFTHFACADFKNKTSAQRQQKIFTEFTDKVIESGYPLPIRHMFNSASVMEMDGYKGELVRSGIMTYGLYPSDEMSREYTLFPAMSLKSSISFIKEVEKGFAVSYGSTFITERKTKIATVPVGYADGYPRYLSNKGEVIIKGTRCPIIGRICMDQFMADITNIPDAKIGDCVTLVGTDGGETVTIDDIADREYRFNYEFCCLINKRVPRIYIKNGKIK